MGPIMRVPEMAHIRKFWQAGTVPNILWFLIILFLTFKGGKDDLWRKVL